MIQIRKLDHFDAVDREGFVEAYTSYSKYFASKTESPDETVIRLRLGDLPRPYVKRFERPTDITAYKKEWGYNEEVFQQGYSFAAYDEDELVGIVVAERRDWNRSLWVFDLHVKKNHRRKGVGTQLLEALVQKARSEGLRVVVCETQNTNIPAIQFYRSRGFEIDGIDLSYYNYKGVEEEVAIFMKLKLSSTPKDP